MKAACAVALCGLAVALFVHTVWSVWWDARRADHRIAPDRPPLGFRLAWPLLLMMDPLSQALLGKRAAAKLRVRLCRGGLAHALTAHQFFSAQCVCAALGGASAAWLVGAWWQVDSVVPAAALGFVLGFASPWRWLQRHTRRRELALLKALPFFIDLLTLSVEAGLNLTGALQQAVDKSRPGPWVVEMNQVMREVRAGRSRIDALRELAARLNFAPVSSLVAALVQGELTGASLGPVLRAQSDQRRTERFQRAEKLAMEAPVKMLVPLVLFIFPCTFIVLGYPIAMRLLSLGL